MKRLAIVQRYVPAYRVPFFQALRHELGTEVELTVIAGLPEGAQAKRGDATTHEWVTFAQARSVRVGSRRIYVTSTQAAWSHSDAVIVPHQGTSLDTYSALLRRGKGLRVGVWGHIGQYVGPANRVDTLLEGWQLRAADHVFAYTLHGAEVASRAGVSADKVTTVMNSLDVQELVASVDAISETELDAFRHDHGIPRDANVLAMVGGLDASKRVLFVADTLDELHRRGSRVHIVVAGAGDQAPLLDAAVERGQVTMLGYAVGRSKALAFRIAKGLIAPGRVGLLAVESLATGLPILTTRWPFHAPEYAYLHEGQSALVSANTVAEYADLLEMAATADRVARRPYPTLEQMTKNFAAGVRALLTN